jgi:hypothetical protein
MAAHRRRWKTTRIYAIPSALIVFAGYLVPSGAVGVQTGAQMEADGEARAHAVSQRGSLIVGRFAMLVGIAALVRGSLSLVPIEE